MSIFDFGILINIAINTGLSGTILRRCPEPQPIPSTIPRIYSEASCCTKKFRHNTSGSSEAVGSSTVGYLEVRIRRTAGRHRGTSAICLDLRQAACVLYFVRATRWHDSSFRTAVRIRRSSRSPKFFLPELVNDLGDRTVLATVNFLQQLEEVLLGSIFTERL